MRLILLTLLLGISLGMQAQNKAAVAAVEKLSPGAALLFKNVKSSLTVGEKNKVFTSLHIMLGTDKQSFTMGDYPVATYIYPVDLNGDAREELFVGLGSVAMFGNVGEQFQLFIRDNSGAYIEGAEFGGGRPIILSGKNGAYPDIVIGGPGFEQPVYRWNGRKYAFSKKIKDGSLTGANSTDIEVYSKKYTDAK